MVVQKCMEGGSYTFDLVKIKVKVGMIPGCRVFELSSPFQEELEAGKIREVDCRFKRTAEIWDAHTAPGLLYTSPFRDRPVGSCSSFKQDSQYIARQPSFEMPQKKRFILSSRLVVDWQQWVDVEQSPRHSSTASNVQNANQKMIIEVAAGDSDFEFRWSNPPLHEVFDNPRPLVVDRLNEKRIANEVYLAAAIAPSSAANGMARV
ncbi:hypothetical protein Cob_v011432 [Colletotrichum orbiculare MAFF 240422]|uniref:Uncharacterized protein n=1 Tax=Colletotrichum orbiculare (strain 104-T / ATCC 96160 / CBS 514.97 / LARS 414 / MAFF 240422) TaxID=1213857 RepID=A0A484FC65_COLOR|nr:hypothetical protein Cob_v011432 [Colletotrichum orbiculare MAFF 240422]